MNIRFLKVWRDLWVNKTRTFLIVLVIAVGVFALGMVFSTRFMLSQDLNNAYLATIPSSAILFTDNYDEDLLDTVRRMDGVLEVEGRRHVLLRLKVGQNVWQDLRLEALPDYDDLRLNRIRPESGAWPPPEQSLLVERAALPATKAQVGDTVQIKTTQGKERELAIAGLVHDMNKFPATFGGQVYGYVSFDTIEWLGYSRQFNEIHLLVDSQDAAEIKHIAEQVEAKVEKSGTNVNWIWVPTPGEHPADNVLQSLLMILAVLGFLSLILSAFLVVNTISAILVQQTKQIGVMKASGAKTGTLIKLYLVTVLSFSFLAMLVAIPAGAVAAAVFATYLAQLLNFDLTGFRIPPQTLVLQITAGLLVPILAGLWPILRGTGITVREAIASMGGTSVFGDNPFERLLGKIRFFPESVLFSLRNIFRQKIRLALTLFTLILAGAIFITVFSVRASLLLTLEEFTAYWNYDVLVEFARPYRARKIVDEAMRIPGVTAVESWGNTGAYPVYSDGRRGNNLTLFAPPTDSAMIQPLLVAGRWLSPEDQNAIVVDTEFLDKEPEVKIGDTITLKWNRRESDWQVVGVVKTRLSSSNGLLFGAAYINYPAYVKASHLVGRANSIRVVTSQDDPEAHLQTAIALEEHFNRIGLEVTSISTSTSLQDTVKFQFNILIVTLSVFAVMLTTVGGLGLMSTMSINVLERAREIGIMRSVGASNWTVLRIFIIEGIFIGAVSWPLAVLLAIPISKLLTDWLGIRMTHSPFTFTLPLTGLGFWLLLILILATAASYLPARNAARMTVLEVLTQE